MFKLIFNLVFIVFLFSCDGNKKSEEFAVKADGRMIFLLIQEYRDTHEGRLPDKLDELDYSAIKGGLVENGKFLPSGWDYHHFDKSKINKNLIILQKSIPDGRSVKITIDGRVTVTDGKNK